MFTVNLLLEKLVEDGKLYFQGVHYRDEVPVYAGDLWRLFSNDFDSKKTNRFEELCEKKGIQVRFEDEIITDDNGKVHETNPGYHGQIPTYQVIADSVWSQDEALTQTDSYLDALLDKRDGTAVTRWLSEEQLTEQGFTKFDYDAESGFHPGQTDTPESVSQKFADENPGAFDLLFRIDDVGQFDASFHLWYRRKEE